VAEQNGSQLLARAGADQQYSLTQSGGNMEGKELRFGIADTALFVATTTAATTGSVNAMHDSLTPLGGITPLAQMMLNCVFGGDGVGLINLIQYAILTVFLAGMMIGRTPEFLGKKIEVREIKLVMLAVLVPPACILGFTALAALWPDAAASLNNRGPHGFSEILYAYASATANNGSAFAGLNANTPFFNTTTGLAMLAGRFLTLAAHAGRGRQPGGQGHRARRPGHLPHGHAAVHGAAGVRGAGGGRSDLFAGAGPGARDRAPANAGGSAVRLTFYPIDANGLQPMHGCRPGSKS
jgi:K+-transporting ATPase A subunit